MSTSDLRRLPSVDLVLSAIPAAADGGRAAWRSAAREVLQAWRERLRAGATTPALAEIVAEVTLAAEAARRPSLRPLINATGVVLQTNLGRAPLGERALAAMAAVGGGYSNLEFDLVAGSRGSRHEHVRDLLRRATGAADGIALNNNAAALLMVLAVFAAGQEVVISRGQAVEIGGGFRIPDVLRQSGARLVEVGTTNRTYARDYAAAIGPETAAILRVHASNFRVVGFVAEATTAELAAIARERGVLLLDDLGSGCLIPTEQFGMAHEPTVQESLAAGADLVLFSGDKLLGGPQCGLIAGRADLIETLRRHPLARALRVDKLTIAGLNATLAAYVEGRALREIPVWQMVSADPAKLRRRAHRWARAAGAGARVVPERSMVGGGSLPGEGLPTWCVAIRGEAPAEEMAARLRAGDPPVVGRIVDGAVLLDPRTVAERDDATVSRVIRAALAG
jgi:L-seryl-tRNA(Ser) seleniumtransferase